MIPRPGLQPFDPVRIGDAERAAAVDRLCRHAAGGRLSMEELEQRLQRAHAAVVAEDLTAIEADLPSLRARRRARRRPPLPVIGLLLAAVVATILVGHPVPPLFILAVLVWSGRLPLRRLARPPLGRSIG
jgi:hypothetical protein